MDVNRDFAPGLQPPQAVTRNVLIELHHPILIKDKSLTYMENFMIFLNTVSPSNCYTQEATVLQILNIGGS